MIVKNIAQLSIVICILAFLSAVVMFFIPIFSEVKCLISYYFRLVLWVILSMLLCIISCGGLGNYKWFTKFCGLSLINKIYTFFRNNTTQIASKPIPNFYILYFGLAIVSFIGLGLGFWLSRGLGTRPVESRDDGAPSGELYKNIHTSDYVCHYTNFMIDFF